MRTQPVRRPATMVAVMIAKLAVADTFTVNVPGEQFGWSVMQSPGPPTLA
jgi:hypothetical protein